MTDKESDKFYIAHITSNYRTDVDDYDYKNQMEMLSDPRIIKLLPERQRQGAKILINRILTNSVKMAKPNCKLVELIKQNITTIKEEDAL